MLDIVNIITLAVLGYIDYVMYKIPNVILCGWVWTLIILSYIFKGITPNPITLSTVFASLLVTGSFIPLRHIVKCGAGDFKLYGALTVAIGLDDTLEILLLSTFFMIIPLASGIKKVPMATFTLFGYIAFLYLKWR